MHVRTTTAIETRRTSATPVAVRPPITFAESLEPVVVGSLELLGVTLVGETLVGETLVGEKVESVEDIVKKSKGVLGGVDVVSPKILYWHFLLFEFLRYFLALTVLDSDHDYPAFLV